MKSNFQQISFRPRLSQASHSNNFRDQKRNSIAESITQPLKTRPKQQSFPLMRSSLSGLVLQKIQNVKQISSQIVQNKQNFIDRYLDQYKKLTSHYQKQNMNLRQQNQFLLERLREQIKKENYLKDQIRKLESKTNKYQQLQLIPQQNFTFTTKNFNKLSSEIKMKECFQSEESYDDQQFTLRRTRQTTFQVNSESSKKQVTQKPTTHLIQEPVQSKSTIDKFEGLNNQFHKLIEQCIQQKNQTKKYNLRKSLAGLAQKMKTLRESMR